MNLSSVSAFALDPVVLIYGGIKPVERIATPDEIADVALFLASDSGSNEVLQIASDAIDEVLGSLRVRDVARADRREVTIK